MTDTLPRPRVPVARVPVQVPTIPEPQWPAKVYAIPASHPANVHHLDHAIRELGKAHMALLSIDLPPGPAKDLLDLNRLRVESLLTSTTKLAAAIHR